MVVHGRRMVPGILRAYATWVRARPAMARAISALPGHRPAATWPKGLQDAAYGDARIRVPSGLGEVSEALGAPGPLNWSGIVKRSPRCFDGGTRVVAVAGGHGGGASPASYAELSVGLVPRVLRHEARSPSCVPDEDRSVLLRYVRDLRDGTLPIDREALRPVSGGDAVTRRAGYDWTRKGNWSRVMSLWSPYLPLSRRGADPDDVAGWVVHGKQGDRAC